MNVSFATQIDSAARQYGLDPRLLAAVAAQETGGPGSNSGRNVVGDGGHGHGLFQIDDRYHAFARSAAAMDPAANARYAAKMISENLKRFGGNVREALSAYNAGDPHATGTKTTWADGQTLGYADSVMRHYQDLGARGALGDPETPLECARADAPSASQNVNALLGLSGGIPLAQAPRWQPQPGLDATGHKRDSSLENYVTGDSQS